jgi:hypothetical protein
MAQQQAPKACLMRRLIAHIMGLKGISGPLCAVRIKIFSDRCQAVSGISPPQLQKTWVGLVVRRQRPI